jgi:hypothetical protein
MLGTSDKSIRRLISRGLIRPNRALRHLLIAADELTSRHWQGENEKRKPAGERPL